MIASKSHSGSIVFWMLLCLAGFMALSLPALEAVEQAVPAEVNAHAQERHGQQALPPDSIFNRWDRDDFCRHSVYWNGK